MFILKSKKSTTKFLLLTASIFTFFTFDNNAAYIVYEKTGEKKLDYNTFGKAFDIINSYAYPQVLVHKEKLKEIFSTSNIEEGSQEESFLREKIKNEVSKDIDILFIPDTLYELYCISDQNLSIYYNYFKDNFFPGDFGKNDLMDVSMESYKKYNTSSKNISYYINQNIISKIIISPEKYQKKIKAEQLDSLISKIFYNMKALESKEAFQMKFDKLNQYSIDSFDKSDFTNSKNYIIDSIHLLENENTIGIKNINNYKLNIVKLTSGVYFEELVHSLNVYKEKLLSFEALNPEDKVGLEYIVNEIDSNIECFNSMKTSIQQLIKEVEELPDEEAPLKEAFNKLSLVKFDNPITPMRSKEPLLVSLLSKLKDFQAIKVDTLKADERIQTKVIPAILKEDKQSFFTKFSELQQQAHENDEMLLVRGSAGMIYKYDESEPQNAEVPDSPFYNSNGNFFPANKREQMIKGQSKPVNRWDNFTLSLGNTFLAGSIFDLGACAWYYMSTPPSYGYVLKVSKKDLDVLDLIFIAPTNPLVAFYGKGELFHSRTKVPKSLNSAKGIVASRAGGIPQFAVVAGKYANNSAEEIGSAIRSYYGKNMETVTYWPDNTTFEFVDPTSKSASELKEKFNNQLTREFDTLYLNEEHVKKQKAVNEELKNKIKQSPEADYVPELKDRAPRKSTKGDKEFSNEVYRAILDDQPKKFSAFLEMGEDVRKFIFELERDNQTLFRKAVSLGNINIVKLFLDKATPSQREAFFTPDRYGQSPINSAVTYENPEMLRVLLGIPNIDQKILSLIDVNGYTLLDWAIVGGNVEIAKILLQKDPNLWHTLEKTKNNILYYPVLHNKLDMVEFLLENAPNDYLKASCQSPDFPNGGPLGFAIAIQYKDLARVLFEVKDEELLKIMIGREDGLGYFPYDHANEKKNPIANDILDKIKILKKKFQVDIPYSRYSGPEWQKEEIRRRYRERMGQ